MTNITSVEIIAKKLIEKKSVTPDDSGCQEYIKNELSKFNFVHQNIDIENVNNIWIKKGSKKPLIVLLGTQMLFLLAILVSGKQTHLNQR